MTNPKPPSWQDALAKNCPDLTKNINGARDTIMADGALDRKTKTLMMMLCDSLLNHADGVANLARGARTLGASEAEIAETLGMAFLMGGLPAIVTGANAFRE